MTATLLPMAPDKLGWFLATVTLLALTPGPDMLFFASRTLAAGRRAGLAAMAGTVAGSITHATAAVLGLSGLLLAAPMAFDLLRIGGALYLVYLAVLTLRSPTAPVAVQPASRPAARPAARRSLGGDFLRGVLIDISNPKMILFYVALLPQFLEPQGSHGAGSVTAQMTLMAVLMNVTLVAGGLVVVLTMARMRRFIAARPIIARLQRWLLATMFGAMAVRLALAER